MTRTELIAALEAAEGPSRELDWQIQRTVFAPQPHKPFWPAPEFTRSLDAALSFTPEGWAWMIQDIGDASLRLPTVSLWRPSQRSTRLPIERFDTEAVTPAIALCIANLRALEAQEDDQ